MINLVITKLKTIRMSIPSMLMLAFASYRSLTSGYSIQLVGVCASIVPFFCQINNFYVSDDNEVKDILSSYILNILLMFIYLAWVILLGYLGHMFISTYEVNPYYFETLMVAICVDIIFISTIIPICRYLKPMQRIIPSLVLINAMLVFMMMAVGYIEAYPNSNIHVYALGLSLYFVFATVIYVVVLNKVKMK